MTNQVLRLNVSDTVATITLNRPEVLNALNQSLVEELVKALQTCGEDDEIPVVVTTGAGQGFCAGGDMKAVWEQIQSGSIPLIPRVEFDQP